MVRFIYEDEIEMSCLGPITNAFETFIDKNWGNCCECRFSNLEIRPENVLDIYVSGLVLLPKEEKEC